jgi:hypothetical protein
LQVGSDWRAWYIYMEVSCHLMRTTTWAREFVECWEQGTTRTVVMTMGKRMVTVWMIPHLYFVFEAGRRWKDVFGTVWAVGVQR